MFCTGCVDISINATTIGAVFTVFHVGLGDVCWALLGALGALVWSSGQVVS